MKSSVICAKDDHMFPVFLNPFGAPTRDAFHLWRQTINSLINSRAGRCSENTVFFSRFGGKEMLKDFCSTC